MGFSPIAPGTAGTVIAIPIYLAFSIFGSYLYLITVLALTALACHVSREGETIFGRQDPPQVVIDEIVGFLWTMALLPLTIGNILGGFILFRLFDIIKPFPIRHVERNLKGGLAIVMDDVVAAVYARIALELIRRFIF